MFAMSKKKNSSTQEFRASDVRKILFPTKQNRSKWIPNYIINKWKMLHIPYLFYWVDVTMPSVFELTILKKKLKIDKHQQNNGVIINITMSNSSWPTLSATQDEDSRYTFCLFLFLAYTEVHQENYPSTCWHASRQNSYGVWTMFASERKRPKRTLWAF